ncbi:MAG TPA: HyaD/HybD family hydrogenase maturation endopeptidase [Blastocatellia bacterium]|nr:HyaD/HybD family hydrogenase maturation endopeptidase [Blastocatellia bacterium]
MNTSHKTTGVLILGIGSVLMGDEGVGVHVVERLQEATLPDGVECLDGGTGSFVLLEPMQKAKRVILIDATVDGAPAGTVRRLRPRFSKEYPRTLTAHDIGLKDLLDAFYLLGRQPDVTLFAVSIDPLQDLSVELSPEVNAIVPAVAQAILAEAACRGHASASTSC